MGTAEGETGDHSIEGMLSSVTDLNSYIEGVMSNFLSCGCNPKAHKIRLGMSGVGIAPNYRIEEEEQNTLILPDFTIAGPCSRTFNGRSHREMTELDDHQWHSNNWSRLITFAELQAHARELNSTNRAQRAPIISQSE